MRAWGSRKRKRHPALPPVQPERLTPSQEAALLEHPLAKESQAVLGTAAGFKSLRQAVFEQRRWSVEEVASRAQWTDLLKEVERQLLLRAKDLYEAAERAVAS